MKEITCPVCGTKFWFNIIHLVRGAWCQECGEQLYKVVVLDGREFKHYAIQ